MSSTAFGGRSTTQAGVSRWRNGRDVFQLQPECVAGLSAHPRLLTDGHVAARVIVMKVRRGVLGVLLLALLSCLVASGSALAQAETRVRASTDFAAARTAFGGPVAANLQLGNGQVYDELASDSTLAPEAVDTADQVALHGNSLASPLLTTLYRLNDANGDLLKWGITSAKNPLRAIPKTSC